MATTDQPGEARRNPPRSAPTYPIMRPLSDWLRSEAEAMHAERGPYRLLDVGCGVKPYATCSVTYGANHGA